jgi:glycerol-3-phosphate acyltransferase PlsX
LGREDKKEKVKKIAVDAMGGDKGPQPIIQGAVAAFKEENIPIILTGDEEIIRKELSLYNIESSSLEICYASDVVSMDDSPSKVVRRKPNSSMGICFNLVKNKRAAAVVSAGNSGAIMAYALTVLKRLPGIERPAIATVFPTINGETVLLDMGANVDCKPIHLVQFALMGEAYARHIQKKPSPKIGLLSNATEEQKGNELTRETNKILKQLKINYLGYIEGHDIFKGQADVVITEGFVGNVVLKTTEGVAEAIGKMLGDEIKRSYIAKIGALLIKRAWEKFRSRIDYAEYGGAPLLGINGIGIIAHGGSSPRAIKNAIRVAYKFSQTEINQAIIQGLEAYKDVFKQIN